MRYFIVALVVSLAWLHQDWFIWPFLGELYEQQNYVPAFVNDLSEDEQLAYTAAFARNREHELVMGLPLGVHFQMFLSFATAAVALLAVWKAWPTELERWAEAGNRGNRGDRDRGRGRGRGDRNRGGAIVLAGPTIKTPAVRLNDRPKMIPPVRTPRRAVIPQTARVGADVVVAVVVVAVAGATHNLNRRQANESPSCRLRIQSAALDGRRISRRPAWLGHFQQQAVPWHEQGLLCRQPIHWPVHAVNERVRYHHDRLRAGRVHR